MCLGVQVKTHKHSLQSFPKILSVGVLAVDLFKILKCDKHKIMFVRNYAPFCLYCAVHVEDGTQTQYLLTASEYVLLVFVYRLMASLIDWMIDLLIDIWMKA